jgi:carboxypeptidase family protein
MIRSMHQRGGWPVAVVLAAIAAGAAAGDDDERPNTPLTRVVKVVRAEDETPIAGATVDAVGLPRGTATRSTGADGTVKFPDMPRRGVTFVARLAGRFPAWHDPCGFSWHRDEEDYDDDGDGVTSFTLALAKGTEFEGRVIAKDDGSPIAGATVVAEQVAGATDQFELDCAPTWTAVTDAEGRFRTGSHFPSTFRNDNVHARITARAPGWISEHVDVAPHGESHAAFPLLRAARLRGVVKDADGKAVAGALVHAYPPDCGVFHHGATDTLRIDEDAHPRVLQAITDATGRYEMPELHPGVKFFVYAEREEQEPGKEFEWKEAVARSDVALGVGTAACDEEAVCDLKLHALSSLVVHVARETGGDAEDLGIELIGPPHTYPSIDDEEIECGRKFERLDPGTYTLRVRAGAWLPLEQSVEVPEGRASEMTVRLATGDSIEGVIVDDLGAPVSGLTLYAYATTADAAHRLLVDRSASTKTDKNGAFRLTGLDAGPVAIGINDKRYVFEDYLHATAPMSGLRIVMNRVPLISLRVDPPPGASLPTKFSVTVRDLAGRYAGLRDPRTVRAAKLPAELDRVRPGPVEVTVDIPGFAPATIRVHLKPGETTPVGPFTFEEGVTLTGRVVDASGRGVPGARVTAYENDARTTSTREDGSFALPHLAPGATDVRVVAAEYPETRIVATAAAGGAATAVVLRPGGIVRGTLRSRESGSISGALLCIYEATAVDGYGPHWEERPGKGGDFSLRLPAGKYRFVPSRHEFDQGAVLFEVTEGGTTEVAFELPW